MRHFLTQLWYRIRFMSHAQCDLCRNWYPNARLMPLYQYRYRTKACISCITKMSKIAKVYAWMFQSV